MSRTRTEIVTMDEIEAAIQEEREIEEEVMQEEMQRERELLDLESEEAMADKVIHDYLKKQYDEYVLWNEDMAYANKGSYLKIPYNEFVAKYANVPDRSIARMYVKYLEDVNPDEKRDSFEEFLRKNS